MRGQDRIPRKGELVDGENIWRGRTLPGRVVCHSLVTTGEVQATAEHGDRRVLRRLAVSEPGVASRALELVLGRVVRDRPDRELNP